MNYHIIDSHQYPGGVEAAISYIHSKWGNPQNLNFYRDAIMNYGPSLPRFFLLCQNETIVGCGALIANDIISRHDLMPWYACHYVESAHRGKHLGELLLKHACKLGQELGYPTLYLSTDHDAYYEKYGWQRIEDGFEPSGAATRIYRIDT